MGAFFQNKRVEKVIEIAVAVFGLYVMFQLIKKILGGSWDTEGIVIGILLFNTGAILTVSMITAEMKSDYKHLNDRIQGIESKVHNIENQLHRR